MTGLARFIFVGLRSRHANTMYQAITWPCFEQGYLWLTAGGLMGYDDARISRLPDAGVVLGGAASGTPLRFPFRLQAG